MPVQMPCDQVGGAREQAARGATVLGRGRTLLASMKYQAPLLVEPPASLASGFHKPSPLVAAIRTTPHACGQSCEVGVLTADIQRLQL